MHIITSLTTQLETLLALMKKDLVTGYVTYNYFIKEVDFYFLDTQELNRYLLETKIENIYPLEKINNLCIDIRNLWNSNLGNPIKSKKLKEWVKTNKENGFYGTDMAFNILFLEDYKCNIVKIPKVTPEHLNALTSEEYLRTDIHKIVTKCLKIRNLLIGTHNSLIAKEDPEQWLIQYQNFKNIGITGKTYKTSDYDKMKMVFEEHIFTARYIFLKLEKVERLEFKNHIIENLTEIKKIQILPEFENLLSEFINQSENNFIVSDFKGEYPFNDKKVLDNFKIYTDKFIVEPYVDYSYLFQRLRDLNLIQHITHNNFMNWLKDNDYVTEKTFDTFLKYRGFRSLKKSYSIQRENNFNNVFSQLP